MAIDPQIASLLILNKPISTREISGSLFAFVFKYFFFLMWTVFKVFVEFVPISLLFYGCVCLFVFRREACGTSLPEQGLNLNPLHWKAKSPPPDCQGSLGLVLVT